MSSMKSRAESYTTSLADRHQTYRDITKRLCPELLSQIFSFCLPPRPNAASMRVPVSISHVDSMWRRISLSTTSLWTQIYHRPATAEGKQRCIADVFFELKSEEIVTHWATCSGKRPLDVVLFLQESSDLHPFNWVLAFIRRWGRATLQIEKPVLEDLSHQYFHRFSSPVRSPRKARCLDDSGQDGDEDSDEDSDDEDFEYDRFQGRSSSPFASYEIDESEDGTYEPDSEAEHSDVVYDCDDDTVDSADSDFYEYLECSSDMEDDARTLQSFSDGSPSDIPLPSLAHRTSYPHLRYLDLKICAPCMNPFIIFFLRVIGHAPNMDELHLHAPFDDIDPGGLRTNPYKLEVHRALRSFSDKFVDRLPSHGTLFVSNRWQMSSSTSVVKILEDAPRLEALDVQIVNTAPANTFSSIPNGIVSYSLLRLSLGVCLPLHDESPLPELFKHLVLPNLQELYIEAAQWPSQAVLDFLTRSRCSLRSFGVRYAQGPQPPLEDFETIDGVLRHASCVDTLEVLIIGGMSANDGTLTLLTPLSLFRSTPKPPRQDLPQALESVPLRRLRRLIFPDGVLSSLSITRFVLLLEARCGLDIPLKVVLGKWVWGDRDTKDTAQYDLLFVVHQRGVFSLECEERSLGSLDGISWLGENGDPLRVEGIEVAQELATQTA